MFSVITIADLKAQIRNWPGKIALVPTMGALHEGHLALVKHARQRADHVIVSLFVNPMQFGPGEDFSKYPRQVAQDAERLRDQGVCELLFLPNAAAIYPEGFATHVQNSRLAQELCGQYRPGHFDGVLTVVNILVNLCQADILVLGKKDYQQWVLIRQMVSDLAMPVEVVGMDTVREENGLAMSSRNKYLSDQDRKAAASIYQCLESMRVQIQQGLKEVPKIISFGRNALNPSIQVQYLVVRQSGDLKEYEDAFLPQHGCCIILFAGFMGTTRLIDNLEVELT